jgi:GMC oxidoreductase
VIRDARHLQQGTNIDCDICIVGAGAAGITLALELTGCGFQIVLLEAGGLRLESDSQRLYEGEVVTPAWHGALHRYRHRRFGGTTVVWGGRCAPFDPSDFERRPYVRYSGWPVSRATLDPYYARAHSYCELGEYSYSTGEALPAQAGVMIPSLVSEEISQDWLWRFSPPTNFGKTYLARLRRATDVVVYLHANCLKLVPSQSADTIDHLVVSSLGMNRFTVKPRRLILAVGGLEAARLLLLSKERHPGGIGNQHDLVGRFYGSHLTGDAGEVQFTGPNGRIGYGYERTVDGVYCHRTLSLLPAAQHVHGLLNMRVSLSHAPPEDPAHRNGVLSAMYLAKRFFAHKIPPEYNAALASTGYHRVLEHIGNVVTDLRSLGPFILTWTRRRLLSRRQLPSVAFRSPRNTYTLHFDAEQSPNPESRVTLAEAKDVFGLPRLRVDWRFQDHDIDCAIKSLRLIGAALKHSGAGRITPPADGLDQAVRRQTHVGSHHLGTARMGADASTGVVDADCRVFGIDNLFIASSAVFPTTSFANPTLTILALTIRLADHLRLGRRA